MAAREGSLVFKEELSAKRTIIREDPEGSRQTNINGPQLLDIVIESCETSSSSSLVSSDHEWINSMVNVGSSSAGNDQGPKIPKVPDMLRNEKSNEGCYDPEVVSIGPYHHEKPRLQEIEKLKVKWAMQFVAEIDGALIDLNEKVKKLYEEFKKVADEAREYYDGISMDDVSKEKFTRMMFLDGCFILHFIYLHTKKRSELGMRNHFVAFVQRDLFLLENQLPYIVLEALMRKRYKADEGKKMINQFIKLTRGDLPPTPTSWSHVNYFGSTKQKSPADDRPASSKPGDTKDEREDHLLHLLRKQFVSSKGEITPDRDFNNNNNNISTAINRAFNRIKGTGWHTYRSAKELRSVGIRFKANTSGEFSDVRFESHLLSGELTLPPLTVDDSTKSMLLNLVALETCPGGPQDFCVTSYICLMDSLLDTVEDVKVLRSHDIVMNYLGSDQQVADLFNDISKNLVPHPNVYSTVKSRIEEHNKNRFKIWIADYIHTHFSSPWTVLAFLGAILAILLTGIQTILAAFPPNSGS